MTHLSRPVIFVLIALAVIGPSAMAGADDTVVPPKRGVVATATGSGGESLVCSLLFVPAIEAIFDDTADPVTVVRGAVDRYANVDFPFLAFEHGDLRHPFIVGFLWSGEDRPPSQQTTIPLQPIPGALGETVSLVVDNLDLLAKPDFVVAVGEIRVTESTRIRPCRVIEGLFAGAEQVTSASGQVSSASQSLAEGSSEQAAAIAGAKPSTVASSVCAST